MAARPSRRPFSRLKLFGILLVCAAPVIASYLAYYVFQPQGRTNYGELIHPQRPVAQLALDGSADPDNQLARFRGKWVLLTVGATNCDEGCAKRLYLVRQLRLTTGKDRERVERALVMIDATRPSASLLREHDGLVVLRGSRATMSPFATSADDALTTSIFLIDPLGNLMMRFPADGDANRIKRDLSRLLRASRVG